MSGRLVLNGAPEIRSAFAESSAALRDGGIVLAVLLYCCRSARR